eukprot:6899915-Alexandrium_andersonii.AAC.1
MRDVHAPVALQPAPGSLAALFARHRSVNASSAGAGEMANSGASLAVMDPVVNAAGAGGSEQRYLLV